MRSRTIVNTQRWLVLGMLALVVLCIVASNLWLAPLAKKDDEATPTSPTGTSEGVLQTDTPPPGSTDIPGGGATLNPVIAELLSDMEIASLPVGDEPFIIQAGDFTVIDAMHHAEGTASIYQIGDTRRVLRLDPFTVTSGPDLHVLLSRHNSPRTSAEALLPTYIDLGLLKNITGAQNYEIPNEIDLGKYKSVVIYSVSFNFIYSTATLEQVRGQYH